MYQKNKTILDYTKKNNKQDFRTKYLSIDLDPQDRVFYNKKMVGRIKGNVFFKVIEKSKHYFEKYEGFGISKLIYEFLEDMCEKVLIYDIENKEYYYFKLKDFKEKGNTYDYDGDIQYILSTKHQVKGIV